ncbi:MAG: hypothetical protein ABSC00_05450 [Acidimicrobiales bacterium]
MEDGRGFASTTTGDVQYGAESDLMTPSMQEDLVGQAWAAVSFDDRFTSEHRGWRDMWTRLDPPSSF